MTRDDIRRMAKEAGLAEVKLSAGLEEMRTDMWQRFAELVAAAEREACAQVCDDKVAQCDAEAERAIENGETDEVSAIRSTAWQISSCANRIRSRENQPPKGSDSK